MPLFDNDQCIEKLLLFIREQQSGGARNDVDLLHQSFVFRKIFSIQSRFGDGILASDSHALFARWRAVVLDLRRDIRDGRLAPDGSSERHGSLWSHTVSLGAVREAEQLACARRAEDDDELERNERDNDRLALERVFELRRVPPSHPKTVDSVDYLKHIGRILRRFSGELARLAREHESKTLSALAAGLFFSSHSGHSEASRLLRRARVSTAARARVLLRLKSYTDALVAIGSG